MLGGDANNDNVVDIGDFGILVNAYNGDETVSGSGYDQRADFTCDGIVDIGDFGVLVNNYSATGDPYQITIDPPDPLAYGKVTLTWHLVSQNSPMSIPAGTTFYVYRSTTPAHDSRPYTTVTTQNASYSYTFTETLPTSGPYYYQVVALPVISGAQTYALSNPVQVNAPNPLITQSGTTYTITGFQPDNTTVNYRAQVANGLLNSYKVNGRELFHASGGANLPVQFGPTDYHTLSDGQHSSHILTAAGQPGFPHAEIHPERKCEPE